MIKQLDKPRARLVLGTLLPDEEFNAIYYNDVEKKDQFWIDEKFGYSVSSIKKYKHSGYKRLASVYFPKA